LCSNYQIIPASTEADENLKLMQMNPIYNDINNPIAGFQQENTDIVSLYLK
jgi:hypothetical protein